MSDYINREMAADCIVLECDDVTLEQARRAIKDCPSADVMPVRHGQWIRTGQSYINPNKFLCLTCSYCWCDLDEHIQIEPRYCPNCGARMDGGDNE